MTKNQATPLNAVGNSAGSVRAAERLHPEYSLEWWMTVAHQSLQYQNLFCQACDERERIAKIIDESTRLPALIAAVDKALAALLEAKVGIADQWKRDGVVGTPLRNASIAVDAGIEALRVAGVAVESNRGTTNG